MKKRIVRPERARFRDILKEAYTYNIFKNRYIGYGFLIGLPIPLLCLVLVCTRHKCFTNPLHLLYIVIPFLFAFLFGCLGTFKIMLESEAKSYKLLYRIKTKEHLEVLNE